MPTHFDQATRTCSRIDRAWVMGPSNFLIKLHVRAHVLGVPEDWHGKGLSDHAPSQVCFGPKPRSRDGNTIPKFVCKHLNFSVYTQCLAEHVDLFSHPVHRQLAILKSCFMEASSKVIRDIRNQEDSMESQRLVFASMSRALWYQQVALAKRLLSSSEIAKQHLHIVNNKVCVINPDFSL